jgi:hypothetical protein
MDDITNSPNDCIFLRRFPGPLPALRLRMAFIRSGSVADAPAATALMTLDDDTMYDETNFTNEHYERPLRLTNFLLLVAYFTSAI